MHPLSPLITPEARAQISNNAWPVFASLSWALVMYIFRWHPESLISGLRSSMVYMYVVLPPFCSGHTNMVQLLGLRPLGLVPQLLNTQQINGSASLSWRIELECLLYLLLCLLFILNVYTYLTRPVRF